MKDKYNQKIMKEKLLRKKKNFFSDFAFVFLGISLILGILYFLYNIEKCDCGKIIFNNKLVLFLLFSFCFEFFAWMKSCTSQLPKRLMVSMFMGLVSMFSFLLPIGVGQMIIERTLTKEGPNIVRRVLVTSKTTSPAGKLKAVEVQYFDNNLKKQAKVICNSKVGNYIYAYYNPNCDSKQLIYYSEDRYKMFISIREFAFLERDSFYTYHDYSLKNPDFVYFHIGYNVCYMAVYDNTTNNLKFTDICGEPQAIKCSLNDYTSIPDTFLVFHNINEKMSKQFTVCAPEVNTPENWAKISDYGYIFHYDVYSKEEIESQCPQIREYIEKYKERNTEK